jgi:hypothetical protein
MYITLMFHRNLKGVAVKMFIQMKVIEDAAVTLHIHE